MLPDIHEYLDYRLFLRDAVAALGKENRRFTFRGFARKAGYSSPNLLQLIIQGKRNLSLVQIPGTAKALGLDSPQTAFLESLVGFDQSGKFDEKEFYFRKILSSRRFGAVRPLDKRRLIYLNQWYNPVVRELATHSRFTGDPQWIADRIKPAVSVSQVRKSLELLLDLGLLRLAAQGKYEQMEALVATEPQVGAVAALAYHKQMLRLAGDALEKETPERRDVRSVTLGLSREGVKRLQSRMEDIWRELLESAATESPVETVYQVNLQMFPLMVDESERNDDADER